MGVVDHFLAQKQKSSHSVSQLDGKANLRSDSEAESLMRAKHGRNLKMKEKERKNEIKTCYYSF